ncbi:hypothetical protein MKW94_020077 [Papaver nudicaule]|uniref:Vacuolar protein sorting-associated protein 41 homolog n=1 Tax=Papaver nudicaule TaxID=74823 RepID=A0AA41RTU5_PAPNU|nr:hypothetical protein [Papaver nudicaule]
MGHSSSENGVEGDDKRVASLKYESMGGRVPTLLSNNAASCIAVAERMIALGSHDGTIHILDVLGNQVKEFRSHTATVNDISFDVDGEYVGSCSDDGSVVINSLFTDEKIKFEYHHPMKAISLDPEYSRNSSWRFVAGGLAGQLFMNAKKWLGYCDQVLVLHSGEGAIHAVKWRTSLIAWVNDAGVKVYDTANDQCMTVIERPTGTPELLQPHLVWQDDTLLVIGWGTSVKIAAIRENANYTGTIETQRQIAISSKKLVDIVASFETSYSISGIAPYGDALVFLAYIQKKEDGKNEPEVRTVTWKNYKLATNAPPVHSFDHGKALAHAPFSGSSYAYLDHLILERRYADAASLCPKLLRRSSSAWKRWIFRYARFRQLPVLVPFIPTENPRLCDTAYEAALVALATNPSFHKNLLSTIKSWPSVIYSALPIISAIEPQLNTSSMTDALKETLAELYRIDGQYEKALELYADLLPELFDFIEKYNLHDVIREKFVELMILEVFQKLLAAGKKCDSRYFLHLYLHSVFVTSPDAAKDFHDMQVELYADYDQKVLLPFLRSSQHYHLEKAYEICVKRDLLREQVFILERMGNSEKALAVIVNKLEDIEEAVKFVTMQHDDELWEELIKQCLQKPEMVGMLLEHSTVGSNLDPLYIVNMLPNGLQIPRLRERLDKIIADYRTETSLRHGCNAILKSDSFNLLVKYYKVARHAVCLGGGADEVGPKRDNNYNGRSTNSEKRGGLAGRSMKKIDAKYKTRGGGRCCMCFDSLSTQDVSVTVFFCSHAYHTSCLMESPQCVLCTTAAGVHQLF